MARILKKAEVEGRVIGHPYMFPDEKGLLIIEPTTIMVKIDWVNITTLCNADFLLHNIKEKEKIGQSDEDYLINFHHLKPQEDLVSFKVSKDCKYLKVGLINIPGKGSEMEIELKYLKRILTIFTEEYFK